jgi:uncharacterized protein YjbI with pentapeptide repeats
MRKTIPLILLAILIFMLAPIAAEAQDTANRLRALDEFDVTKNSHRLIRTKSCPGCYLVNAKLSRIDLSEADLRNSNLIGATLIQATLFRARLDGAKLAGANFSGALWIDGSICLDGSIGQCLKQTAE